MTSIFKQCAGAWRFACMLLAVAAIGIIADQNTAMAQCEPAGPCNPHIAEARIRDIAAANCHVRVYYRIVKCNEDCHLIIDSLVYPTYAGDCSNCIHDLTQANIDAIVRQIVLHGMYFGPCGLKPEGSLKVRMPACWKQNSGSGTGGGWTNMGACGPVPCCIVTYTIIESGGLNVGLVETSRTTDPLGPYDCSSMGGGCRDICN